MLAQTLIHSFAAATHGWRAVRFVFMVAAMTKDCKKKNGSWEEKAMKNSANSFTMLLLNRAKELAKFGYSVIAVHGNQAPAEPKKPAMKWREFQQRIASEMELEAAFGSPVTALGIVCGRVSQLLVIDFDDQLRYQRFCRHLPQFSQTYTVKTRRGYHVYFRTSERVPSHQFEGGDIKGERSYIIAAPSIIGDYAYTVVREISAMQLEKAEIDQLLNYFHVNATAHRVQGKALRTKEDLDLPGLYQRLAKNLGRNNALYRAASVARSQGIKQENTAQALIPLHVRKEPRPGHKRETTKERLLEGQRTIDSAYRGKKHEDAQKNTLPNFVRERLLRGQNSTVVARFLDVLQLAGWEAESFFTLSEAIAVAKKYGLDRKSVMSALTGERCVFDGRHIISRRYVEYLDMGGRKARKRGRPVELVFQVPSVSRLLAVLNVRWSPSDPVSEADVKSARQYRLAVHREYVRRLSPEVPASVLAERLGVTGRTIRRYNRALGVTVVAHVGRFRLTRENVTSLPLRRRAERKATAGYWLETAGGIRMPAWRHIGESLLRRGESAVQVCMWRRSRYVLNPQAEARAVYHRMSVPEFVRARMMRGEGRDGASLMDRAKSLFRAARRRVSRLRYVKTRLQFESVPERIAEDKVAETINGYLLAYDAAGEEVRRPARRGVAFRMLKEFGDGNVFLALRDSYSELLLSLAGRAIRAGKADESVAMLARAFA